MCVFIHSFFCQVKIASARSRRSLPAEQMTAKTCADALSDGPNHVLSEGFSLNLQGK
jgi:hypothetical protein